VETRQPLADLLRPQTLDDVLGQDHLLPKLRTFLSAARMPSMLLFGPPGSGKSTLALILARQSGMEFIRLSAPEAGLAQLRKHLAGKQALVLDELHRFSKAQQDFFLPLLESGEITLFATTTENPSFSVTRQLLSRLHVLRLNSLGRTELAKLAEKGFAALNVQVNEEIPRVLSGLVQGDARSLLNLVEHIAALPDEQREPEKLKAILPDIILRHDKAEDSHYELASALIKSIRGSDPDAALYYLAALLESGEEPRFVCRRMILSASEDVGLADPQALPLAVACQQAVEFVGMPEGFIPMAETAVYLALAPKSNSSYMAYLAAQKEIKDNGARPVPLHLRNPSTRLMKEWGFGQGYKYPHNFPKAWVEQEYLPEELRGRTFYQAKDQGAEPRLASRIRQFLKGHRED